MNIRNTIIIKFEKLIKIWTGYKGKYPQFLWDFVAAKMSPTDMRKAVLD